MKFIFSREVACYAVIYYFFKINVGVESFISLNIFIKSFLVIYTLLTAIYSTRVHKDQIILWRKMHLKCFCLWIYRDGILIKQRQCRDNCRGDQILHRQDNRLLPIVRRTKMMTSYRQIPVPSNKVIH